MVQNLRYAKLPAVSKPYKNDKSNLQKWDDAREQLQAGKARQRLRAEGRDPNTGAYESIKKVEEKPYVPKNTSGMSAVQRFNAEMQLIDSQAAAEAAGTGETGDGIGATSSGASETTGINYYGDYEPHKPPPRTGDHGDNGGTTLTAGLVDQNYTGPYISGGKIQQSVKFGDAEARSLMDYYSRLHDTAYAEFKDRKHRYAADLIYYEKVKELVGMYPALASRAVKYGNIATSFATNPFGFFKDHLWGVAKAREEIERLYAQDPHHDYYQHKLFRKSEAPKQKRSYVPKWLPPVISRKAPKRSNKVLPVSEELVQKQAERMVNHAIYIKTGGKKKKKKRKINDNIKAGMARMKSYPPRG